MRGADLNDHLVACAIDGVTTATAPVDATPRDLEGQITAQVTALRAAAGADAQPDALWVTLSPPAQQQVPGELLRQLRAAGHAVQGFVDRTALLAAWLDVGSELAVLELTRRHFAIGLASRDADVAALRRHVPLSGGLQALQDAWIRLAAATLVQQTRFDPLHDLRHEAALRAQLPQLVADAMRDGQGRCALDTGDGKTVTVALTRDQLASAARPVLAPVGQALQALSAAHGEAVLVVPESVLGIPGLDEAMAGARFVQLFRCGDDVAARAASLQVPSGAGDDGGVPWRTRLPLLATPAPDDVLQPLALGAAVPHVMATHVVYRGRVVAIPATGLVLGRAPGDASAIQLPEGIAGLSRRHCTLRRDGQRTQVIDHSSHGTYVDGARVRGRALLPAGGVLRLGDPGIELPLVAIEAN